MIFQNTKYETVPENAQHRANLIISISMIVAMVLIISVIVFAFRQEPAPIFAVDDDDELMFIDGVQVPDGKATR